MISKILIPVDGSTNSFKALEYGIYIARILEASLIGVHVVDVNLIQGPVLTDISGSVGMPPYDGSGVQPAFEASGGAGRWIGGRSIVKTAPASGSLLLAARIVPPCRSWMIVRTQFNPSPSEPFSWEASFV